MKVFRFLLIFLFFTFVYNACGSSDKSSNSPSSADSTGKSGSTARFTIVNNSLYVLSGSNLQVMDITNSADPKLWIKLNIGWNIETIFAYENNLFIGSPQALYIYDNTDPANPKYVSDVSHRIRACDPVVVEGKYAYVTLRNTNGCRQGFTNRLDIIDISKIEDPKLLISYPMQGPYGLGIDKNKLFICDGMAGLKIFDVTDPLKISLLQQLDENSCSDLIPNNNILFTTGEKGTNQYNYSEIPVQPLSTIDVKDTAAN